MKASTRPRFSCQLTACLGALILATSAPISLAQGIPALPASPAPVSNFEYDAEGNLTKIVAAPSKPTLNLTTQHTYDPLSRRKTSVDAKNGLTQFGYNGQSSLNLVTDPRGLNTQYSSNGLGDPTALVSPDTGTTTFTYDAAGNVKTGTDARGYLSTYSYDALGRMTALVVSHPAIKNKRLFSWVYDQIGENFSYSIGRLTTAKTPEVSTTFAYDALGRVTKEAATMSPIRVQTVAYSYDTAGHVTSLTYPSGRVIDFEFENGQPRSIKLRNSANAAPMPVLSQITVSPFGPVKSWQWELAAGPKLHERAFDSSGRMVRHPLGALVRDLRYDEADRISSYLHYDASTGAASQAFDQRFSYDALSRLTQTQLSNTTWSFVYDANGNRTAAAVGATARAYAVAADSNRLGSLSNPQRSFSYDAAGNLSADVSAGSSGSYTASYSPEGRLASMTVTGSKKIDMAYDAQGRRVRRALSTVSGPFSSTPLYGYYAYDAQGHLIGEYDHAGAMVSEYVWLGDTPVAVLKPNALGTTAPPEVYFVHTDHLDAPRVLVDKQDRLRWRWMAEPFGITPAENSPTGLPVVEISLRLPGQQFDSAVGLHYNMFRDYDATIGRYVQSDPIGLAGGINTYAYVGGNPISYVDPLGLDRWGATPSWTTADGAGKAAVCSCNSSSIAANKEMGNWVTKNLDGTYAYSAPITGTASSIPGFPSAPSNAAGWYHTHGAYSPAYRNEDFSGSDKSISNRSGVPGYLGTPSGAVKKYSPTTGDTSSMGGCP